MAVIECSLGRGTYFPLDVVSGLLSFSKESFTTRKVTLDRVIIQATATLKIDDSVKNLVGPGWESLLLRHVPECATEDDDDNTITFFKTPPHHPTQILHISHQKTTFLFHFPLNSLLLPSSSSPGLSFSITYQICVYLRGVGGWEEGGRERFLIVPFEVINPLDCWKREGGVGELGGGLGGGLGEKEGGGPVLPIRSCVVSDEDLMMCLDPNHFKKEVFTRRKRMITDMKAQPGSELRKPVCCRVDHPTPWSHLLSSLCLLHYLRQHPLSLRSPSSSSSSYSLHRPHSIPSISPSSPYSSSSIGQAHALQHEDETDDYSANYCVFPNRFRDPCCHSPLKEEMERELQRGMEGLRGGDGRGKQYVVKREDGFCVKIWMQAQVVCPGESFAAEIDFSKSQIPCKKLTIFLEEREFLSLSTPSSTSPTSAHATTTKTQTTVQETHTTTNVSKIETRIFIPSSCRLQFMGGLMGREWVVGFGFGFGRGEEDVVFSCPLEVVVKDDILEEMWKKTVCGKVVL